MLHSPIMPRCLMTLTAAVRSMWYSSFESVWEGATTTDSPVWMPMGSKFSMLHTVTQLSDMSRTTSYSASFQPLIDFSTSTWGDVEKARGRRVMSSSSSCAKPLPRPPSANAARMITGYPMVLAASTESSMFSQAMEGASFSPISSSFSLKISRSSAAMMVETGVPSTLTPYFCRMPEFHRATPVLRAVCPPNERVMPSGLSFSMICSTNPTVTGRK
mmetsp:Transcript_17103/g.33616  ORF Transcript_17103/g.33616 Transcript_17103/m.33616 type:complete len:217 (-) Transcript_17103:254-904(-)